MNTNKFKLLMLCIAVTNTVSAQDMWTYFSPADFAKRRAKLMEQIGDHTVAVAREPNEGQHPDGRTHDEVQPEERAGDALQTDQVRGDRHDAGRHCHREDGRVHSRQRL